MEVRYYLDPDTEYPHIYQHGVDEEEVEFVLQHADEDSRARGGARQSLGQTAEGRYIRVIYVPDPEPNSVFVITAYELRGKPLQAYRRRQRRRRRR